MSTRIERHETITLNPKNGNTDVKAEKDKIKEPIFSGVSNKDIGLISGVASAITGGVGVMRAVDLGVGKSVLKKVGTKNDLLSLAQKKSAYNTLKGTKWQIPAFLLTSLATGLFAKYCFDA